MVNSLVTFFSLEVSPNSLIISLSFLNLLSPRNLRFQSGLVIVVPSKVGNSNRRSFSHHWVDPSKTLPNPSTSVLHIYQKIYSNKTSLPLSRTIELPFSPISIKPKCTKVYQKENFTFCKRLTYSTSLPWSSLSRQFLLLLFVVFFSVGTFVGSLFPPYPKQRTYCCSQNYSCFSCEEWVSVPSSTLL